MMDLPFNPLFVLYVLVGAFTSNMYVHWVKETFKRHSEGKEFALYTMVIFFIIMWPIFWFMVLKEKVTKK